MEVDFETFWKAWPRKVSRKPAEIAFNKLNDGQKQALLSDVEKRTRMGWWPSNPRRIPHAATFINQERWKDEWQDELEKSRRVGDNEKPNSGAVTYEPIQNSYKCNKWEALCNRLFLKYLRTCGGMSERMLGKCIKIKNDWTAEAGPAFDEDVAAAPEDKTKAVSQQCVLEFARGLMDRLDKYTGKHVGQRVLGRHA